jgi:hypothetical protein
VVSFNRDGRDYPAAKQLRIKNGHRLSQEYRAEVAMGSAKEVRISQVEREDIPFDSRVFTLFEGERLFGAENGWRVTRALWWHETARFDLWLES